MLMRKSFRSFLKKIGLYNALRYSKIYHAILKFKNPAYIRALNQDLSFYRMALGDSLDLVFDVGANHGDKAWVFKKIAKRVVCFEPDEACFSALTARYGRDKEVSLENIALGGQVGTGTLFIKEAGSAYNTTNKKERDWLVLEGTQGIREATVAVSTLDNMIEKYGAPDFLKIDVEGDELRVFKGLSHSIAVICFEANLPRFREETLSIVNAFSSNPAARFNLRYENTFIFSSPKTAEEIIGVINQKREISYDVFVYADKYYCCSNQFNRLMVR